MSNDRQYQACEVSPDHLRRAPLFHMLRDGDLALVASVTTCRSYRRDAIIGRPGHRSGAILLIHSGIARLYRNAATGGELTLALFRRGDVCGLIFLEPSIKPKSSVQALVDGTEVYRVPQHTVIELARAYPGLRDEVYAVVARRLVEAYDWMALRSEPLIVRVGHVLGHLAEADPDHVVPVSYQVLASIVGASEPAVARALGGMRREGLVRYRAHHHDRRIFVPDPSRLVEGHLGAT